MVTLIKNIRISRHVGCWLSLVVTGKICSPAKNGLTNAVKLVNIFGWLGWQTRQKNVRQGDYYPRANDDKIFSSSLPHNSAPAASVCGRCDRVHLSHPNYNQFPKISLPVIQLAILMLVCNCLCALLANCKVLGLKGGCYDVCNFDCLFRVWNCEL